MKIPKEIEEKFYEGLTSDKTKFGINASVSILNGPHQGEGGSVISIIAVKPQTKYLVELANGSEIQINETELAPL